MQHQHGRRAALLCLFCCALYSNTIFSEFVFDDAFAIVDNKDVVDSSTPLSGLLKHDFWGQDIASPHSHKSYRPLTVLSFRLLAHAAREFTAAPVAAPHAHDPSQASERPPPFGTAPFHLANIFLHCLITCAVYRLALQLSQTRESGKQESAVGQEPKPLAVAAPPGKARALQQWQHCTRSRDSTAQRLDDDAAQGSRAAGRQPATPLPPEAQRWCGFEAFLAAWLFAAHPIHTEAVAGIVGHAELLCAALFLAALLTYICAVCNSDGSSSGSWKLIAAAAGLVLAAAAAKEIGITAVVSMLLYDLLMGPLSCSGAPQGQPHRGRSFGLRAAVLAVVAAAYVGVRQAVSGGEQLVSIYRKVENPIPFADSRLTRALSTGHLHARYFGLLLAPWRLSADWSFACVPLVASLADPRNLATVGLWGLTTWMAWMTARLLLAAGSRGSSGSSGGSGASGRYENAAAPKVEPPSRGGGHGTSTGSQADARWACFVFGGLLAAPFLPASNLLVYVGTYIGERLLYIPSISFCLLAARGAAALQSNLASGRWGTAQLPRVVRRRGAAAVCVVLLAAYSARTFTRNYDWANEGTLFIAAHRVCPNSAKVQLNNGILRRRTAEWGAALAHFQRAQDIEPGYCEPTFWRGLTLLNANRTAEGLVQLEEAITCPYVAAKALQALNQAYMILHRDAGGHSPALLQDWARVLAKANRTVEACEVYEQLGAAAVGAASSTASGGGGSHLAELAERPVGMCMAAIQRAGKQELQQLAECVQARAAVRGVLLRRGPASAAGLQALHSYLAATGSRCRGGADAAFASDGNGGGGEGSRSAALSNCASGTAGAAAQAGGQGHGAHMALVHAVQKRHATDPHLQAEWAAVLAADGRFAEAMRHFQVAGMLFGGQHGSEAGSAPPPPPLALGLARAMTLGERAAAAAHAFDAALSLRPTPQSGCVLLQGKCAALGALLRSVPRGEAPPAGLGEQHRSCVALLEQQCGGGQGPG